MALFYSFTDLMSVLVEDSWIILPASVFSFLWYGTWFSLWKTLPYTFKITKVIMKNKISILAITYTYVPVPASKEPPGVPGQQCDNLNNWCPTLTVIRISEKLWKVIDTQTSPSESMI